MQNLPNRVTETLKKLSPQARRLLVAVSGGADSVALLRLLAEKEDDFDLVVAHFNHGLRAEAMSEQRFIERLAAQLGVPFYVQSADVRAISRSKGWNLEDGARRLRYDFLLRTAKELAADATVTAHTLDDQAETVMMQLLRGAAYLTGMEAQRGKLLRPLLGIERAALLEYLDGIGQGYCTDTSNFDKTRTRAWLRHEILPLLRARYPRLPTHLGRLASLQADLKANLRRRAGKLLDDGAISLHRLGGADPAVQREAVSLLLEAAGLAVDSEHIAAILEAARQDEPQRVSLNRGYLARLAYGQLTLVPAGQAEALSERPAETYPPGVDAVKAAGFPNLVYRSRRPGDRIRLTGGGKKVSDLLIDRKVAREDRDALRMLASGSEVLWIEGVATDVHVKADASSADPDLAWMRVALEEARAAAERGELPVGAVVVKDAQVISRAGNTSEAERDPTQHAELRAIRAATEVLGDWRLSGCRLYVTLEPCAMCYGAMLQSHLSSVVYGAKNLREGALGGVVDLQDAPWKRKIEVRSGVFETEAAQLLSRFFEAKRS